MNRGALLEACAGAAFFVSGASALVFETLWFEKASLVFGNDIWASSSVLAAFMLGMAGGQSAATRFGSRFKGLQAFAALELIAGATGVALIFGLAAVEAHFAPLVSGLAENGAMLNGVRVFGAFALMLVPSAAMGASLPVLTGALATRERMYGRVLGLLYGANTAGGVLGVLVAEMFLIPRFGLQTSGFAAGAAELAVGVLALLLSARVLVAPASEGAAPDEFEDRRQLPWLLSTFLAGLCLLALEVVWVRVLTLLIDDTSSAFAAILAVVLSGMALGGLIGGAWLARSGRALERTARVAYLTGLAGLAGYFAYPAALSRLYVPEAAPLRVAAIASPLVLPVALGSGILFTLIGAGVRRTVDSGVAATARVATLNTVGAGLGSLLAGFVLLPYIGMDRSLFALLALYGIVGFVASLRTVKSRRVRYAELGAFVLLMATFPFGKLRTSLVQASAGRWLGSSGRVVEVREGRTGTLVHIRHEIGPVQACDQIVTNAYSMTANDFLARRYMKFFVYLPVALEPDVSRALVLGYGMGNTAKALVDTREVKRIDVVDVSTEMLEMSRHVMPAPVPHPLDDPRIRVHIGDARYFLRSTTERYDLITGEPPPPVMAHVASLYSEEYFYLLRDRLAPGGMVTYWLPTMNLGAPAARSLVRAFCNAFLNCSLWSGAKENFVLVGSGGPITGGSDDRFVAQWKDPVVFSELRELGFDSPGQLGAMFIGGAEYLRELTGDDPPLTDDFPKRILVRGAPGDHQRLIGQWRDAVAARDRFRNSAFVLETLPPKARQRSLANFENQRLLNDLTFSGPTHARQLAVLDQVLFHTTLRLHALLLLKSDPDVQRGLASVPVAEQHQSALLRHAVARALVARDPARALEFLGDMPDASLPMPGLRRYVEEIARPEEGPKQQ